MAGTPAGLEVADGHRGRRRTVKDTKLVEEKAERQAEDREERGRLDRANDRVTKSEEDKQETVRKVVNIHFLYHRSNS